MLYVKKSYGKGLGFFQIGGGIAGDFPICVEGELNEQVLCANFAHTTPHGAIEGKRGRLFSSLYFFFFSFIFIYEIYDIVNIVSTFNNSRHLILLGV